MVLKRDGRHEEFSKEKLLSGIKKACQKRPVSPKVMEDLVDKIVDEITSKYEREVPGDVIGKLVMEELRGVDTKPLLGHLAAWNYFESVKNPVNAAFIKQWKAYAVAHKLPNAATAVTNDPMEATYVGIHMWAQAVEKAKSTDTDKVIAAMAGQTFNAPSGFVLTMDETNHHLHKPVMIGEIKGDGQFSVVWKTKGPIRAQPWSPFIPGNEAKQKL